MQTTVRQPVTFSGVGLHSGAKVSVTVLPAAADHGIVFRRTDAAGGGALIPALWNHAVQTPLCTQLEDAAGHTISTIEHLMAALAGCGIHNALIEIDGAEVPILDGSSREFVAGFIRVGLTELRAPIRAIEILHEVSVTHNGATARLSPATSMQIDFEIDFPDEAIGHQAKLLNMSHDAFQRELQEARTFCRLSDVEDMREHGLALGGTMENAVVVDGPRVVTPGGLRYADEPVRHKMLDALGDLYTAGAPIIGRYTGQRAGHAMTNRLLRALFADPTAWRRVSCTRAMAARLPGMGYMPQQDAPRVA
ncbi:UDP-3-O-[3-hydroxymyristoyl] N-acetylglucosamine deacetylase [Ketogulonicigenium robustum]|uniref:UDP-3-O-acyl-N-acetylglucosamine deacetylase n=1 Tax=Ketogulonicigenium robustum TaxID=92947 RepID=A0A1W6P0Y1_9RHOB|nr:UDP-3-O-acyl-N-acetylglucosamine deacetylase [Ketogulonicigenium robustum]ARO14937.1 UDP-3-O-[3-hydroxymyristoyl] N-acetylglucosamine deacetylase [Ketogulonicigenium robustum]